MLIRTNILPKSKRDASVIVFLFLIIPLVYYFELFVVLPRYHEQWSFAYNFHFLSSGFLLFNICSNLVAIILCDTSIRGRIMPTDWTPNWKYCSICETITPPRSWHCDVCDVCILKRDHHCIFTGCCIGNDNHRYFILFVFYMFVATLYASYYNLYFIWNYISFNSWASLFKVVFPLATIFMEWTENQIYVLLMIIVMLGCTFTGALLCFHIDLMLKSVVSYERGRKSRYNRGPLENTKVVLGEKWYLVWLSPFIKSQLPSNGIDWSNVMSSKDN